MSKRRVTEGSPDRSWPDTSTHRRLTRSATRNIVSTTGGKSFRKSLHQTPKRRSLHQPALEEFELIDIRERYFKKPMYMNSVTPLFMFNSSARSLYEKELVERISNDEEYDALQLNLRFKVKATTEVIDQLRTENSENEAVSFKIIGVNKETRQEKVLYECVLFSINPNVTLDLGDKYMVLPVMLWNGGNYLKKIMETFLMQKFKCHITTVTFTPIDLAWLVAMYAVNQFSPDGIQLTFSSSLDELNSVQYRIDYRSVEKLIASVVDNDADELRIEEVSQIMSLFQEEFLFLTSINLDSYCLCDIVTPTVMVSKTGRIRIKHHHRLFPLLGFFTTMAEWNMY